MPFCPKCKTLMLPKDGKFECSKCGDVKSKRGSSIVVEKQVKKETVVLEKHYMASVISKVGRIERDGVRFLGKAMAHELGHCFALKHRRRGNDGSWAGRIPTWPVYQLPRPRAFYEGNASSENLCNLVFRGISGPYDRRKGDLDLLQARVMRTVEDPSQR